MSVDMIDEVLLSVKTCTSSGRVGLVFPKYVLSESLAAVGQSSSMSVWLRIYLGAGVLPDTLYVISSS